MKNIKIILNENKTFTAENIDEVKILEDEHNATVIEVHFPEDYANYSKRVDFLNIRNEKWTTSLYAPEDENNKYNENFDKLVFRFTIPSAMAKRGELQIQFIAYLVDGSNTIVPFQVILATINKSIIYAVKEGRENPDLLIKAYEYSNEALRISRESFDKINNAERAAIEAEKSAKNAENSAKSAQTSATNAQNSANSANTRAINAENSAKAAQESAEYAEEVSNQANSKSDQAVATSNTANSKSSQAVATSNTAIENSEEALKISNDANTKAASAVNESTTANTKSDNAVAIATESRQIAQESNNIASSANTKAENAVNTSNIANANSESAVNTANSANSKSENALATSSDANTNSENALNISNTANTKADNAVNTANNANDKSDNAVSVSNKAKETAEEALNQVIEKMGTKVFIGSATTPEANVSFNSDPQSQITENKNQIDKVKNNETVISNSKGGFSAGANASATANGAVQLGSGTNANQDTLQFKDYQVVGANGNIPKERLLDVIYPVGSIYMSVNATSPQTLFGGTWERLVDRFLIGAGNGYSVGAVGGETTHTLTVSEMPVHSHGVYDPGHGHGFNQGVFRNNAGSGSGANVQQDGGNNNTSNPYISAPYVYSNYTGIGIYDNGGGGSHNNMPPYLAVYMWKRTG